MGETLDEHALYGVDAIGHDDRNSLRRRLRGDDRRIAPARDDDVDLVIEKLSGERGKAIRTALRQGHVEDERPAFDPPELAQRHAERVHVWSGRRRGPE